MPTCCKCGAPNPTVHLTKIVNQVVSTHDYCEACFEQTEFKAELKLKARLKAAGNPYNESEVRAAFEATRQRKRVSFADKVKEICERDSRFSPEAYDFAQKSLNYALKSIQPPSRHITARDLVEASERYAMETWGASAKTQLQRWGIGTSSHIGDIVFLLIENNVLGKRAEDNRSDFDHLPFLVG